MSKKIGRNDPCPCGSGLKYKKCCIDKTDDMEFSNPINFLQSYKEARKAAKIKQCLHPNHSECFPEIIGLTLSKTTASSKRLLTTVMYICLVLKLITHLRFKRNMDAKKRQYSLDSVNIMIAEDGVAVFLMPDDDSAFPLSFLFQAYHSFARRSSFCHIGHLLFI